MKKKLLIHHVCKIKMYIQPVTKQGYGMEIAEQNIPL